MSKKKEYHKTRMDGMNKEEYIQKYEGLDHLFYEKRWFADR